MAKENSQIIKSSFEESIATKERILENKIYEVLEEIGEQIVRSMLEGGKVLFCGNGGSAADAQHLAAEFLIRLNSDVNRQGLPALSLVQDSSTFTACINDFGPEEVFSRNLASLGKANDVLLAISTSGNSANIIRVLQKAKELKIKTIGFLGKEGGEALNLCDLSFVVPSNSTARIQESHITAGHSIIQYTEEKLLELGFIEIYK